MADQRGIQSYSIPNSQYGIIRKLPIREKGQ